MENIKVIKILVIEKNIFSITLKECFLGTLFLLHKNTMLKIIL